MAYNVNNEPIYVSRMITRLWGRRIGLDLDNMLVGPPEHKLGITTPTTAGTASPVPAHGYTNMSATAATTAYMDAPIPGVRKSAGLSGTGTSQALVLNGGNFQTTLGSSFTRVTFQSTGDALNMIGVTTGVMAVLNFTAGCSFTTTT